MNSLSSLVSTFELTTAICPLGIRFWDAVGDRQVTEKLIVRTWPKAAAARSTEAYLTPSGVFAFRDLPGLRHLEHPPQGISPWQSPLETRRFVVEAQDLQRHFLPLVLELDLPFRGIFPKAAAASPPMSNPEGCYLFSAPTRPVMPGWAAIRATLVDAHTQEPVAHAVLEIQIDEQRWYGIANDQGNVVILFPYPSFSAFQSLSSPLSPVQQAWTLQIQVRYDPNALVRVPGSSTPTLRSIFDQAPGRLWQTRLGPSEDLRTDLLIHDEQLIIKTGGGHDLWLSPTSSPI